MKKFLIFIIFSIIALSYFFLFKKDKELVKVSYIEAKKGSIIAKTNLNGKIKYDERALYKIAFNNINNREILVKEGSKVLKGEELIKAYDFSLADLEEDYFKILKELEVFNSERDSLKIEKDFIEKDSNVGILNAEIEIENFNIKSEKLNLEINSLNNEIFDLKNSLEKSSVSEKYGIESKTKVTYLKNRLENLEKEKDLKLKEIENLKKNKKYLEANLDKAILNKKSKKLSIEKRIRENEENIKLANIRKEFKEKKVEYQKSLYKSPISGTVLSIKLNNLDKNREGIIIEIANIDNLFAVLEVPDYKMKAVEIGKEVDIIYKVMNRTYKGKINNISAIASKVDNEELTVQVEVMIENLDNFLKPGYEIEAEILTERKDDIIKIPLYTILEENNKSFVYVLDNDIVRKRAVTLGISSSTEIEVEGIKEGEKVIKTNMHKLSDGLNIKEER